MTVAIGRLLHVKQMANRFNKRPIDVPVATDWLLDNWDFIDANMDALTRTERKGLDAAIYQCHKALNG